MENSLQESYELIGVCFDSLIDFCATEVDDKETRKGIIKLIRDTESAVESFRTAIEQENIRERWEALRPYAVSSVIPKAKVSEKEGAEDDSCILPLSSPKPSLTRGKRHNYRTTLRNVTDPTTFMELCAFLCARWNTSLKKLASLCDIHYDTFYRYFSMDMLKKDRWNLFIEKISMEFNVPKDKIMSCLRKSENEYNRMKSEKKNKESN